MRINKEVCAQFLKFGIVGISNTVISYVTYIVLINLGVYYILANIIGFVLSVINSFFWNNKYVFKISDGGKRNWAYSLFKTFLSYAGTGLILANILLMIWVEYFKLPEWIGPLINLIITIPLNFIINKFWAFREDKD